MNRMFHRFSTPILVAILLYHGYHYHQQYMLKKNIDAYVKSKRQVKNDVSHDGKLPTSGRIIKVNDFIYVATGYALGNSILMIGDDGVVIVDTTESVKKAGVIALEFRKITDKPIKGIVYTHNHVDHVVGTKAFYEVLNSTSEVQIWAHHSFLDIWFHSIARVGKAHSFRAMHQFGVYLDKEQISAGIGTRLEVERDMSVVLIPPNRLLKDSKQNIKIAGMELTLMHVPGETDDTICVHWPKYEAVIGTDNLYKAFPNLYAIRGTPFRNLKTWYESLDKIRNLNPQILAVSHHDPIIGKENISNLMKDYRDAIQLVHDQTVRFINQGLHPDEIAARVTLPKELLDNEYLKEIYGTVKWSSKGLFAGYMGWFSGDIVELDPLLPTERSLHIVSLAGGIENLLLETEKALKSGDSKWALYLADSAHKAERDNYKAKELKAKALINMAELQTSVNGYNYFKTVAYRTIDTIKVEEGKQGRNDVINACTIPQLFHLLSLNFMAEIDECSKMDKMVLFIFPDIKQKYRFYIRHGVMDLSGVYKDEKNDLVVTTDSTIWKAILKGELKTDISVEPSIIELKKFLDCIAR